MDTLPNLFSEVYFHLANITLLEFVDLGLVTILFYLLLNFLRRNRSTVLLRGALIIVVVFFLVTVFLPLATFDYLLRLSLLAMLIATPVIFQAELRYGLEQLGRSIGSLNLRRSVGERTLKPLVRALENLSSQRVGALIVLEGEDNFDDILETGVAIGSTLSSELLQTIFYDGTPLHDGALLIRGERIAAAGCVLPVSNRQLYAGERRLGTRHRAAVGLTESSDALVLVVSEETGQISVARNGRLEAGVEKTELREHIYGFYNPPDREEEPPSMRRLFSAFREWWQKSTAPAESGQLFSGPTLVVLSILLAFSTWLFVSQQTDPIRQERFEGVPLQVTDRPQGMRLLEQPEPTVTVVVRSSDEILPSLGSSSFRAYVSLAGLEAGLHRLEVEVESGVDPVQIVSVEPQMLDLELADIISLTVPVQVVTLGEESLSPAFEIEDAPMPSPDQAVVTGVTPQVEKVERVVAELEIMETVGTFQRVRGLTAVDERGEPVSGISIEPSQVQVSTTIARRANARDVGVSVERQGELPEGYRLARLSVSPSQVTLIGEPENLAEVGNTLSTLPLDMTTAVEDLDIQVALDLPPGVEAIDSLGENVRSVLVRLDVEPLMGNRVLMRTVQLVGEMGEAVTFSPSTVQVSVSGPVPLLDEIEAEPNLLLVTVDASALTDLESGETIRMAPSVTKPASVDVELTPSMIEVTIQ